MGEEVHRDLGLEDVGDLARLEEQMVVEKSELAAPAAIELADEVKGHSCTKCPRVFSTGKALGGHMSSAHGRYYSSSKKLKSKKEIENQENSAGGKFTCKSCGKNFISEKAVHGHMRLHKERDRGILKPPTESEIENPVKDSLEPELHADGFDSEYLLIAPTEDFIKNLREKTVTGRRGRRGTKPHEVDYSPETCLLRKRALLSGDPQELRKIMYHHDDSGYFRRAFGNYLDLPWPEIEKKSYIHGEFEMGNNRRSENLATSTSDYCSNCPLVCSEKMIADSISKAIYENCMKSSGVEESKNLEHEKQLEGTTSIEKRLTGKKRKRMDSNFVENKIIKKMKTDLPHTTKDQTNISLIQICRDDLPIQKSLEG